MSTAPSDDRFDWDEVADDVVCHLQPMTAVYVNPFGHIVIRQADAERPGSEDDSWVTVSPELAGRVARAIMAAAAASADFAVDDPAPAEPQVTLAPAAPLTPAERARPYRQRRHGNVTRASRRHEDRHDDQQHQQQQRKEMRLPHD
jgi:hypothetical protein